MIILERLEDLSFPVLVAIALFLALAVGAIDYVTGREMSFSVFYLLPILFVTWFGNKRLGVYFSLLSSLEWIIADQLGNPIYSHPTIPYWNMLVRLFFFLIIVFVTSRLKSALEREKKISRADPLTGVSNARHFYEFAEEEIQRARRYDHFLTVVYIDLDNFKRINDHLGHLTGDRLLLVIADTIRQRIRSIDRVARLGGDEFAVLLPEISHEDALRAVERMRTLLLKAMQKEDWAVTFSMGVVTFKPPPSGVDELIREADDLMYVAKREGKNRIKSRLQTFTISARA